MSAPPDGGLLAIDVDAELRDLGLGALDGPHQVAAECVRLALRRGARRVVVDIAPRRLRVAIEGASWPEQAWATLQRLLDRAAPASERHAALVTLERARLGALLGLAALAPADLRLDGRELEAHHAPLDAARARDFLRRCARFAPADITLDGRPLAAAGVGPFDGAEAHARLRPPLAGHVAWTGRRGGARVWLLAGGLIVGHVDLPEAPAFEATYESDAWVTPDAGAEARRAALAAHLPALIDQALEQLVGACAALSGHSAAFQRHARAELLAAARGRHGHGAVRQAKAWPAWVVPPGERRWFSLDDLAAEAERARPARRLLCAEPSEDPADLLPCPRPILCLDAEERGALAEIAGVSFESAARRSPPPGWARARRAVAGLLRALRQGLVPRVAPLADSALAADERALLQALERELRGAPHWRVSGVSLSAGHGAPRLTRGDGRPRLVLARGHADVRAAARAVRADARWGWTAALALLHAARGARRQRPR